MSSNFPAILNPMEELINSGLEIRAELQKAAIDLELAIEGQFSKRQVAKELKRIYDEMEAEYTAETMFAANGKNAESRKAELEAALVKARRDGFLARAWAQMNAAAYDAAEAESAYEQCSKRFRATEAAADLTAALLRAATR